jgi:hypothetical protein
MTLIKKIISDNKFQVYIKNCKVIETDPEKMYSTMYPIMDIDYLDKYISENIDENQKKEISDLFEVEQIINKCDKTKCISVSFFCQNVNNTYKNQYGVINFNNEKSPWYKKYYINFQKFINNFNNSIYYKTYKLRIYLENQLSIFIPKFNNPNIEIYIMKQNSIGGCPGMLWRYLVFDDKNIEIAHVFDIDEDFNILSQYIDLFSKSDKTLGRYFQNYEKNNLVDKKNIAINYPVVYGGIVGLRPNKSDILFTNICINYILYKISRSQSNKPNLEFDTDIETIYNMPINNYIYGWGSHWFMYGFDERIWKHLFFPYFVKKGEVLSYSHNNINKIKYLPDVHPTKIDYNFCKYYNNEFSL